MANYKTLFCILFTLAAHAITYAQVEPTANNEGESGFERHFCAVQTDACYAQLNEIDPASDNKTEKCAVVLSVAECLTALRRCNYVPSLKPLFIKYIEDSVPGGVSGCSNESTETAEICQREKENCHSNFNTHLRNASEKQQKCDAALAFTNCLYSIEQCAFEEAVRALIFEAAEESASVSNCQRSSTTTTSTVARQTSSTTRTSPTTTLTAFTVQPVTGRMCGERQFACGSGECIDWDQICDGRNDCGDNSDEENCRHRQLEIQMELTQLFQRYGCNDVLISCANEGFRSLSQPTSEEICTAVGAMFRCAAYERCSLGPEDRERLASLLEESFSLSGGVPCSIPRGRYGVSSNCVDSCQGKSSGDYQSCLGCDVYVTCVGPFMYDSRPCPAGLVWDDHLKRCEYSSTTCNIDLPA